MSIILALETTGVTCSVALFNKGITFLRTEHKPFSHSKVLHLLIQSIFEEAKLSLKELEVIALSAGPGSYTGLRVGSSTAKGLCSALDCKLMSIPTHQTMLSNPKIDALSTILCTTDARRDEVFCSQYEQGILKKDVSVQSIENQKWITKMNEQNDWIIGSGAEKIAEKLNGKHQILPGECLNARYVLEAAIAQLGSATFENIAHYEPRYEKAFYTNAKKVDDLIRR